MSLTEPGDGSARGEPIPVGSKLCTQVGTSGCCQCVCPPVCLTGKAGLQDVGAGWVPSPSCLPSTPYFFMHIHILHYRRDMKAEFSNDPVIVQISVTP